MTNQPAILSFVIILLLGLVGCDSAANWDLSGKVEWHTTASGDVAGVWNPETKEVEWHTTASGDVAGVWNPETKEVEWHTTASGGVAGVWNPETKEVEWHTTASGGVAGVFVPKNPSDYHQYLRSTN